jgi:hypothetical protein
VHLTHSLSERMPFAAGLSDTQVEGPQVDWVLVHHGLLRRAQCTATETVQGRAQGDPSSTPRMRLSHWEMSLTTGPEPDSAAGVHLSTYGRR